MPFDRPESFTLAILLLALPLQFLLVSYYGNSSSDRDYSFHSMIFKISQSKTEYWRLCNSWFHYLWGRIAPYSMQTALNQNEETTPSLPTKKKFFKMVNVKMPEKKDNLKDESLVKKNNEAKDFGLSLDTIRSPRPSFVKFRIGQVIKYEKGPFRGVIIGWDEFAKGSESMLKQLIGENKLYRQQPNYAVLIDGRDSHIANFAYVPQDLIVVITRTHIIHPEIDKYFESYNGKEYVPRPWFKKIYPHD